MANAIDRQLWSAEVSLSRMPREYQPNSSLDELMQLSRGRSDFRHGEDSFPPIADINSECERLVRKAIKSLIP